MENRIKELQELISKHKRELLFLKMNQLLDSPTIDDFKFCRYSHKTNTKYGETIRYYYRMELKVPKGFHGIWDTEKQRFLISISEKAYKMRNESKMYSKLLSRFKNKFSKKFKF